ncbi:MAG: sulfotransferase family protein [bacterium]
MNEAIDPIYRGTVSRLWMLVRLFGRHRRYGTALFWLLLGPVMQVTTRAFLFLDHVFYPQLRRVTLDRPVFIVGHPRSGTTFLQRQVFGSHTAGMFTTWELFFPSLIQRRILAPFVWVLNLLDVSIVQSSEYGHEIRIDGVEEDEGVFMHRLATEILTFNCPWLLTDPDVARIGFRLGWLSRRQRLASVRLYREFLKRQMVATGHHRIVLKCNPSVFRLRELFHVFPDARVVYVVRSPEYSVRSYLAFAGRFVLPLLTPEEQRVYFRRKYEWSLALYREFEAIRDELPADQLLVLPFEEISRQLPTAMERFFRFAELNPEDHIWRNFRERRHRRHRKRHVNQPLGEFGIAEEDIRRDLAFVWDRYLFEEAAPEPDEPSPRDDAAAQTPG